jgi:predicted nucleotidyltransferase
MTDTQGSGYGYADEATLLGVYDEAESALEAIQAPFLVMGGIASGFWGRPRWTRDIDLFVRPEDSGRVLEALASAGFETSVEYEDWLAKAKMREIVVDVIYRSHGDILLDDEMKGRSQEVEFKGRKMRLVPPEDLVVMKAVATSESTPRYWYDAIAMIGHRDLDWDYLLRRARQAGVRRVLSLLLYAQSVDIVVPHSAISTLMGVLIGSAPEPAPAAGRHP